METLKDIELEVKTTQDIRASLDSKIQEARTQKQAEQDEWVSLESYWLKVAEKRDWENAKSNTDSISPCKMSVKERKEDAIRHFKQRALKKAKELGIEYKTEFIKSIRNGKEMHYHHALELLTHLLDTQEVDLIASNNKAHRKLLIDVLRASIYPLAYIGDNDTYYTHRLEFTAQAYQILDFYIREL